MIQSKVWKAASSNFQSQPADYGELSTTGQSSLLESELTVLRMMHLSWKQKPDFPCCWTATHPYSGFLLLHLKAFCLSSSAKCTQ